MKDIIEEANKIEQESKKPNYWPDGVQRMTMELSFLDLDSWEYQLSHHLCYLLEVNSGDRDPDLKRTQFGFNVNDFGNRHLF